MDPELFRGRVDADTVELGACNDKAEPNPLDVRKTMYVFFGWKFYLCTVSLPIDPSISSGRHSVLGLAERTAQNSVERWTLDEKDPTIIEATELLFTNREVA